MVKHISMGIIYMNEGKQIWRTANQRGGIFVFKMDNATIIDIYHSSALYITYLMDKPMIMI